MLHTILLVTLPEDDPEAIEPVAGDDWASLLANLVFQLHVHVDTVGLDGVVPIEQSARTHSGLDTQA